MTDLKDIQFTREWLNTKDLPISLIEFITETKFGLNGETRYLSYWGKYELELYPLDGDCYELFVYQYSGSVENGFSFVDNCPTQIPVNCPPKQAKQFFVDAWLAFKRGLDQVNS